MKKRIIAFTLALAMVMAAVLTACGEWASAADPPTELPTPQSDPVDGQVTDQVEPVVVPPSPMPSPSSSPVLSPYQPKKPGVPAGITLVTDEHISYLKGTGSGMFSPNKYITRGEAAVILYRLLSDTVPVTVSYSDVSASSWYAEAAGQLGSLGVIRPNERTFKGNEYISRGEFISYIACFFPMRTDAKQFPDVPSDYAYGDAILSARAWGWVEGFPNGTFAPKDSVRRSEAVTIINRALGRSGDQKSIAADRPALYLDVSVNEWYYNDVIEATVSHTFAAKDGGEEWLSSAPADTGLPEDFRTEGYHLFKGWCYYYDAKAKDILRSCTSAGNTYDAEGHFTTGDATVDAQLREIVLKQAGSGMTRQEILRSFYAYCRDSYKYLKWNVFEKGDTSFTLAAARQMLSTSRGNCYCYASVFWYLARWLGYDAKIYSGTLLGDYHSWVEIDGYIYDTQMEWRWVHERNNTRYLWYFYQLKDSNDAWQYRK